MPLCGGGEREYTCIVRIGSVSYCFIVHHLSAREGNQVERHHRTDANAPSTLDKSRSVYRDNARTCGRGLLGHWQILVSHRVNAFRLRRSRHGFHSFAGCIEEPGTRKRGPANWIEHSDPWGPGSCACIKEFLMSNALLERLIGSQVRRTDGRPAGAARHRASSHGDFAIIMAGSPAFAFWDAALQARNSGSANRQSPGRASVGNEVEEL